MTPIGPPTAAQTNMDGLRAFGTHQVHAAPTQGFVRREVRLFDILSDNALGRVSRHGTRIKVYRAVTDAFVRRGDFKLEPKHNA